MRIIVQKLNSVSVCWLLNLVFLSWWFLRNAIMGELILQFSSAPSTFAPFHCQAIENKNQNHLMDKVQKLGNKRKYTLFSLFSRLNSCIYLLWCKTLNLRGKYIYIFYKVSNLQKREKDVNCLLEIILGIPKTRGYCYDTRITLTAPARQKDRSSGNEKENRPFFNFSLMRSAFRHCVCEESFAWNFALRQWLPICAQIPSLRAVFKFQDDPFLLLYYFLRIGFYTVELPIPWP